MKFVNYFLSTTIILITVLQIGCLSRGVMVRAEKLVQAKDYSGAIEVYQSIVDTKAGTADARTAQLAIGRLYIEHMNQPEHGIKTYVALITDAPASDEAAEAHYRIGMHAYYQKDIETAQTQFNIIVNQFSHLELSNKALLLLARCYEKRQQYEQAIEIYDDYVQQNPQSKRIPQILAYKARILRKHLNDDEEAIRTMELLVKKFYNSESVTSYVEEAKNVLSELNVTPFGFGPYPEVPADFPYQERLWDNATPGHELLARVRVKLWKQGIKTVGAVFHGNGLIYPIIPGILYVKWVYIEDGEPRFYGRRYPNRLTGEPKTAEEWRSLYLTDDWYGVDEFLERIDVTPDEVDESGIKVYIYPNSTKVYEYPDGGIDPYDFLGLPKDDIESTNK